MTETQAIAQGVSGNRIFRFAAFLYGLVAYLVFFAAFLYAVGFVTGLLVPKTIDDGRATSVVQALIIDLLLMTLFAVQHSLMARKQFDEAAKAYLAILADSPHDATILNFTGIAFQEIGDRKSVV